MVGRPPLCFIMDGTQIFSVVLVLISMIAFSVLIVYYSGVIRDDLTLAVNGIGTVFNDARTFVGGVLDDIGNQLVNAGNLVVQAATTIGNTIAAALTAFYNDAIAIVGGIGGIISSAITDFGNAIVALVSDLTTLLSNGWDSVVSFFTGSIFNAIEGIINAIKP